MEQPFGAQHSSNVGRSWLNALTLRLHIAVAQDVLRTDKSNQILRNQTLTSNHQHPDELRQRMAQVRQHLQHDVQQVVEQAKEMTDWRTLVQRHPWASVTFAAIIGYTLVPNSKRTVHVDSATLHDFLDKNSGVTVTTNSRSRGVAGPVVRQIGAAVIRAGLAMAAQQLSAGMLRQPTAPTSVSDATANQTTSADQ